MNSLSIQIYGKRIWEQQSLGLKSLISEALKFSLYLATHRVWVIFQWVYLFRHFSFGLWWLWVAIGGCWFLYHRLGRLKRESDGAELWAAVLGLFRLDCWVMIGFSRLWVVMAGFVQVWSVWVWCWIWFGWFGLMQRWRNKKKKNGLIWVLY